MENQEYGQSKLNTEQAVVSVAIIQSYVETIFELMIRDYSPLEQEIARTLRQLNYLESIKSLISDVHISGQPKLSVKAANDIEIAKSKLAELKLQRPPK